MSTFSLNPTYYQVTWNLVSPTDYSGLSGDQNGGLDPISSWQINREVTITGTVLVSGAVMAEGETIIIDGRSIAFSSTDTLADIVGKINLESKFTAVVADQSVAGGYITLRNQPTTEGQPFYLAEGNGSALSKLGLVPGVYRHGPSEVGGAFSSVTTGSNVTINGINIVFSSGGLVSTASQISARSADTGVIAYASGPYLQLTSKDGQPWVINSGNAVANLGTTLGNHGGLPSSLANSQAKERANMRWQQAISELQSFSTTNLVGNIVRTGNVGNVALTTVTFTVGYERPDQVVTVAREGEPDAGNVLVGTSAVRRAVARALVCNLTGNRKVFDPTMENFGAYTDRPNAARIQAITASALDTLSNIGIIETNLAVTQIAGV